MDIERIKTLIAQREQIDSELVSLVTNGTKPKERKPASCKTCGSLEHTARNCTKQDAT